MADKAMRVVKAMAPALEVAAARHTKCQGEPTTGGGDGGLYRRQQAAGQDARGPQGPSSGYILGGCSTEHAARIRAAAHNTTAAVVRRCKEVMAAAARYVGDGSPSRNVVGAMVPWLAHSSSTVSGSGAP
jgi:hypothetical protein